MTCDFLCDFLCVRPTQRSHSVYLYFYLYFYLLFNIKNQITDVRLRDSLPSWFWKFQNINFIVMKMHSIQMNLVMWNWFTANQEYELELANFWLLLLLLALGFNEKMVFSYEKISHFFVVFIFFLIKKLVWKFKNLKKT